MKLLVTGGCGFIGSNFLNLFAPLHGEVSFLNWDGLFYAANPHSLLSLENSENYRFRKIDLADSEAVHAAFQEDRPDAVLHLAAESHVDRSIKSAEPFLRSNVLGTLNLLSAASALGEQFKGPFVQMSTDEVFGSVEEPDAFTEDSPYHPNNPYAASKAAADHFASAYAHTHNLSVRIVHCSNNYGPRQQPEKLIPLMVLNALQRKPLPVYGRGEQVRDWIFVGDHCRALWQILTEGQDGRHYMVGAGNTQRNLDMVRSICQRVARLQGAPEQELLDLIQFVQDRPGHDPRYAVDASRTSRDLGWEPAESFDSGLDLTVKWYLDNPDWVEKAQNPEHHQWLKEHYGGIL
ncbi:MAG: dTDP-glucose 4,6-dehydratase [Fimbriimonadaceae bacterium]